MLHFSKDELKYILEALETIQEARQSITASAVIDGHYSLADHALKGTAERENIIHRIKQHLDAT